MLQLGKACGVRPEPELEALVNTLEVWQGRAGQEIGATGGKLAVPEEGVQQFARAPNDRKQAVELREPALFDVCHTRLRTDCEDEIRRSGPRPRPQPNVRERPLRSTTAHPREGRLARRRSY